MANNFERLTYLERSLLLTILWSNMSMEQRRDLMAAFPRIYSGVTGVPLTVTQENDPSQKWEHR